MHDPELSRLSKLIRASPGRRTRFHTLRGERLGALATIELVPLAVRRAVGRPAPGPWLPRPAVRYLEKLVRPDWRVLELGAGSSTTWYANRVAHVLSVESDPDWGRSVQAAVAGLRVTVEVLPAAEFPTRIATEDDESYDLIVVDGAETGLAPDRGRVACVRAASAKVKPGGVLLLDNSDRPAYREAESLLSDWMSVRVTGFPSSPFTASESTFFTKPPSRSAS